MYWMFLSMVRTRLSPGSGWVSTSANHCRCASTEMNIFPGLPAQFIVELMLDAALARVFHADRTQHLRRQIARGIKPLRLFLEMNPLQLQRIDALDGLVVGLARHPAESFVRAAIREHHVVVIARDARDQRNRGRKIFDFGRHSERGIDQHRHRQFVPRAVVDHSALGGQRNGALLLMSRLLDELVRS